MRIPAVTKGRKDTSGHLPVVSDMCDGTRKATIGGWAFDLGGTTDTEGAQSFAHFAKGGQVYAGKDDSCHSED